MTDLHRRKLILALGAGLVAVPAYALAEGGVEHAEGAPKPRPKRKPVAKKPAAPAPAADPHAAAAHDAAPSIPPEEAMNRLMSGNARYCAGLSAHPHANAVRRIEVAAGQRPFAVILACADSRVAPELIFDQGLGDLFVVDERQDVTTFFLKARWNCTTSLRLDARYEFETGDEGDFHTGTVGLTLTF